MKRYLLFMLQFFKQQTILYVSAAIIGGLAGIFIFYPLYDFIYFHEHGVANPFVVDYVLERLMGSLQGETPKKTWFLARVGMVFGLILAWFYGKLHQRLQSIERLRAELSRDLKTTIQQGESSLLEFKSSARWDFKESRINRILETVIIKTLAGFLNSSTGGTLLIGVADDGGIIGLQQDLDTLKRKDADGYEQMIITLISTNLGADLCQHIQVLFHRIDGKKICRLIISPSPHPVFFKQKNDSKFYLRTGGGTRDLNIQEATEFISHRWHQ